MESTSAEAPGESDGLASARAAAEQAIRVAEAAAALLRAEMQLARSSALSMLGLSLALIVFGVGAWLAASAAIAIGIQQLTGNLLYGVGGVALVNLLGAAFMVWRMRGCWRDLGLPRTRRLLARMRPARP